MSDEMTPEAIADTSFPMVRRGYSRAEVDAFLSVVSGHVRSLEARVSSVSGSMEALGFTELPDVKRELEVVSSQVGDILEEARRAAQEMRNRAAADAGQWRAEAATESRGERDSAQRDSEKARKDAWDTSTEMLNQASERRDEIMAAAEQDGLFIRAEAEREALRMTGDSRRYAEEAVREARNESDRVMMGARAEAETILVDARHSAESAQERARALEQRRSELLEELESARTSIGQLENEIDSRREALHQAATGSQTTMRVIESTAAPAETWADDDASVKIVPARRIPVDTLVDADALVAEVEQLRAAATTPVVKTVPADEPVATAEEPPAAEEPEVQAVVAVADHPEPRIASPAPNGDRALIDSLFATLRAEPSPESDTSGEEEPAAAPAPDEPAAGSAPPVAVSQATQSDPFDVRDRHLLPISNRSLRSVKREIVELQNRALEDLRTSTVDWQPDGAMVSASLSGEVGRLVQESFVAGHAAAAELLGSSSTPQPVGSPPEGWPGEFVDGLTASVSASFDKAIGAGGGARQISSAVSKVFRAWRTDEAERRLRLASRASYHAGLLGGFSQLDIAKVMALAPGRPCGDCAAGTGVSWSPGGELPDGVVLPPARLGCDATVVPALVDSWTLFPLRIARA